MIGLPGGILDMLADSVLVAEKLVDGVTDGDVLVVRVVDAESVMDAVPVSESLVAVVDRDTLVLLLVLGEAPGDQLGDTD